MSGMAFGAQPTQVPQRPAPVAPAVPAAVPAAPVTSAPPIQPRQPAPSPSNSSPANTTPANTTPSNTTPSNTTPNNQSNPQPNATGNTLHLQPSRDHDHDGDRNNDRRGPVYYLPWWGETTGPNGWSGSDGWTTYDNNPNNFPNPNNGNGYTAPAGTGTSTATTMPAQPSAAGAAAQTTNAVEKSPEILAANNAVQSAQADYDKQRARVLVQLRDKPEYAKAAQHREETTKNLGVARSTVSTPVVTDAATAKLDASSEVTKMEEQAIATDPDASAAKSHLADAIANRDALKAKLARQY